MRPVLQGQGLGFPLQGQRRPLKRAENKSCSTEVWTRPELLCGGSPEPGALQVSIPAWARAARTE